MENLTSDNSTHQNNTYGCIQYSMYATSIVFVAVGLPLALVEIIALCSVIRADHVAPVYVINLLISDLVQLCCAVVQLAINEKNICHNFIDIQNYGIMVSICFIVIISLERYLSVAWPLWYRLRRNIKTSVKICIVTWLLCLSSYIINKWNENSNIFIACFLLLPFPLLIFFLWGTLKALTTTRSVHADEKRRIIAVLVLVVIIYALMFLPDVIYLSSDDENFHIIAYILLHFSPLADLVLYVFMRKGIGDKILAYLCGKMMPDSSNQSGQNSGMMELGSPLET